MSKFENARRSTRWRAILASLGALVSTALLFEVGTLALVQTGRLDSPPPSRGDSRFWRGDHPDFGVWHEPNSSFQHRTSCFNVTYRTNSVGARDVERPVRSESRRTIVLGDSFFEGWGVSDERRLSNLLENASGLPHLNFAMAHFGFYQQVRLYELLARQWDHDSVLASFLPSNDFADIDLDLARTLEGYDYLYRPYLVGEAPNFVHLDHREPRFQRFLRHHSYAWNALAKAFPALRGMIRKEPSAPRGPAEKPPSRFYDFGERRFALLVAILERLAVAAGNRSVVVVLVPSYRDLLRYAKSGPDPLSRRLAESAEALGVQIVNLLPSMANYTRGWKSFYLPCDYHWSTYGNRAASEILLEALSSSVYRVSPEA